MTPLNNLAKKFPVVFALVSFALAYLLVRYGARYVTLEALGSWGSMVREIALAAFSVVWALLFFGRRFFAGTSGGLKYGMRKSIYFIIIACVLGLSGVAGILQVGMGDENPLAVCLRCVIDFLAVGVFEEIIFRGCLLGGLVARWGKTRAGIVWAVVISSLLFGFVHVISSIIDATSIDAGFVAQVVGKTVETGCVGMFLAAVYLRTRNVWPVIIVHAITDFLPAFPTSLSASPDIVYVSSGTGIGGAAGYAIIVVAYIPLIVMAVQMIKQLEVPFAGPLYESFTPCDPVDPPRKGRDGDASRVAKATVEADVQPAADARSESAAADSKPKDGSASLTS